MGSKKGYQTGKPFLEPLPGVGWLSRGWPTFLQFFDGGDYGLFDG